MASPHKKPRIYTPEERLALVTEIDRHFRAGEGPLRTIANALGTSDTNYYNWVKAGIRPAPAPEPPPPGPVRAATRRIYSPAERKHLMAEVERLRGRGKSIEAACRVLGISDKSFRSWKATAAAPPIMRPVEVTALVPVAPSAIYVQAAATLTLLAPGGYRVEGLDLPTTAALLRALA